MNHMEGNDSSELQAIIDEQLLLDEIKDLLDAPPAIIVTESQPDDIAEEFLGWPEFGGPVIWPENKRPGRQPDMEINEFFWIEVGKAYAERKGKSIARVNMVKTKDGKQINAKKRGNLTKEELSELIADEFSIAPTTAYDHYKFYNAHLRRVKKMRKEGFRIEDNDDLIDGVEKLCIE